MDNKKLYIKNMVCNRCIMVVKDLLDKLEIVPQSIKLGEVTLEKEIDEKKKELLSRDLEAVGFYLIDDKKSRLIEQIKTLLIKLVHYNDNDLKVNLSEYISEKLHHDYNYISNLFSEVEGTTIEKYFITLKIERVKELLVYDELTLNEIACQLNYSSTAHLSAQFKKITGFTPSHFKKIKENKRKPLDEV
ncbi:helix-turn-helix transcriptional regulator [Dysgonomonas sp. Marseille-P4677]|uniref:helix-turn-helix domain-containing protein n=1 Tax=Dysgonomonas sp. Marseille-P4677 TaxID=2364790 RepID=UPI001912250F|nr:AraC family transcriptional regulator [Dysgonomonas sp. Marseille-P4677]MBK5720977.1 helix-turn-helix transcriptional regulator [Dysgonomonas sp. Marseille-P4677]